MRVKAEAHMAELSELEVMGPILWAMPSHTTCGSDLPLIVWV